MTNYKKVTFNKQEAIEMNNLINEQVNLVLEDLELMTNPYERCMWQMKNL